MNTQETWRPIPGHPNYEVSDLGRVRRVTGGRGVRAGRILKPWRHTGGYRMVSLYSDGVRTARTIHTLVHDAFIGPRAVGVEVNHVDGDKTNNRLTNLSPCTGPENKAHASRTGLTPRGERSAQAKLTDDQVDQVRAAAAAGEPQRSIARRFGIAQPTVSDIVRGRRRAPAEAGVLR